MENEPEKGIRCTMCFDMRFERTALYAAESGFTLISSSLGISRWKNMQQINDCGHRSASHYPGISYWDLVMSCVNSFNISSIPRLFNSIKGKQH